MGQSFSFSHLAPFIDVSRQRITKEVTTDLQDSIESGAISKEKVSEIVEKRLLKEIKSGVQTIQYQLLTLMTTNGQTPFVTAFMYLNEVPEGRLRDDLNILIKEVLRQRMEGVKNKQGVWITPAFPKLIYVLDENNISEGTEYWETTVLAAKCTAKRLVPDYISAKVMKELKNGNVYTPMGCVDEKEVIDYKINETRYVESFAKAWNRLALMFGIELQPNKKDYIINPKNVTIWDNEKKSYVAMKHMIKNHSKNWLELTFSNGRVLDCTPDHPFETNNGVVLAKDLSSFDEILIDDGCVSSESVYMNSDAAWCLGLMLCDGQYETSAVVSLGLHETDILNAFVERAKSAFGMDFRAKTQERGVKGNYFDVAAIGTDGKRCVDLSNQLKELFGATVKFDRHIPSMIFDANKEARLAFLAGMIDADGYVNSSSKISKVQIGSTNKELALQQMLLAQSLGMRASVYRNHYRSNKKDNVRYMVEFIPTDELVKHIVSEKKRPNVINTERSNFSITNTNKCTVTGVTERVIENKFSYDVTTESEHFTVSGIYSHNCRSFLTVEDSQLNPDGSHKFYGRFNQGVVTINLVDVACSSYGDMNKFWEILDERLELCHRALRLRHERLLGTPSDVAPILWQHGAIARLKEGELIDKLLYNGYSTISLGYAGLCEMCYYMIGETHTSKKGEEFALKVMQRLNDKCAEWKAAENISYSTYGTPMEGATYKFAKNLKKRFGVIPHVTDKNYITNSYHVHVTEKIDAFSKLKFESKFQKLSPGGAISYVEIPNMQHNIEAVLDVMKYIYENIMYAELNTKSDYCQVCGYEGEISIVDGPDGKPIWECPNCGNHNHDKMNTARRVCGYIGNNDFNAGRMEEVKERVLHL